MKMGDIIGVVGSTLIIAALFVYIPFSVHGNTEITPAEYRMLDVLVEDYPEDIGVLFSDMVLDNNIVNYREFDKIVRRWNQLNEVKVARERVK